MSKQKSASLVELLSLLETMEGPRLARKARLPTIALPATHGLGRGAYWQQLLDVALAQQRLGALVVAVCGELEERTPEIVAAALSDYPEVPQIQLLAQEHGLLQDRGADIAIVTVIREEYEAVLELLKKEGPTRHWGNAHGEVNLHAWTLGQVQRTRGGSAYRVVLGMVGQAGNLNSKDAVRETVERFKPHHLLLVGIAGGLPRDGIRKGSLVISDLINGYEPGKIESPDQEGHDFHPRLTQTFPVDNALRTAALAVPSAAPGWHHEIALPPPDPAAAAPNVVLGPIASGEKVIDDASRPFFLSVMQQFPKIVAVEMEGAGAASAIQQIHEKQTQHCGFLMLRGISDLPRTQASPADQHVGDLQRQERDQWKRRAAAVAACFAIAIIRHTWPREPRGGA